MASQAQELRSGSWKSCQSTTLPSARKVRLRAPDHERHCLDLHRGRLLSPAKKAASRYPRCHRIFPDEEWQPGEKGRGEKTPPCVHPRVAAPAGWQHPSPNPQSLLSLHHFTAPPSVCLTPDTLLFGHPFRFRTVLSPRQSQAFGLGMDRVQERCPIPFHGHIQYFLVQMKKCSAFSFLYMQTVPWW